MIRNYVLAVNRLTNFIVPAVMLALAGYSIWYCHTALSPFSRMRRILALDQRVRTALFQSESIQRGFLLTRDTSSISLYAESKANLRIQAALFADEIASNERERDVSREIVTLVGLKINEMDSTIEAGQRADWMAAMSIPKTRVGLNYSSQICNDLGLIRGIETGRTYRK